jgi:hypothetical protein
MKRTITNLASKSRARKVHMLVGHPSIFAPGGDLPGNCVDEYINWFWKRGSMLYVVVADETEGAPLGEDRILFVY